MPIAICQYKTLWLRRATVDNAARSKFQLAAKEFDRARRIARKQIAQVLPALSEQEQLQFLEQDDRHDFQVALSLAAVSLPGGAAQFLYARGKIRARFRQRPRCLLLGTILSVDDSIGRMFEYLQETKQLDNTIIVLVGDNGLLEGEHGMVDKRTAHEARLRIPLLVRYPALAKGKVIEQQALTIDVAPSLLELCGAKSLDNIHDKSWANLAREGDACWRKSWFYEYNYQQQFPFTPNVRAVRTDDWKYIHYPHGDGSPDKHMAELYDIKNDPQEQHNLNGVPKFANQISELKTELARLMNQTGLTPATDQMPIDAGIKNELPDKKIR